VCFSLQGQKGAAAAAAACLVCVGVSDVYKPARCEKRASGRAREGADGEPPPTAARTAR